MNVLARLLSRTLKSSIHSRTTTLTITRRNWVPSQHFHSTTTSDSSCRSRANKSKPPPPPPAVAEAEWPRPSEILYHPKLANSVNLIGYVGQPVQLEASTDGKFWAGTVVSQRTSSGSDSKSDSSPNLWIPLIFEGDLAHTAACHLKKNDRIHIAGKLFVDPPPSNVNHDQAHVQVMVHVLHFVQNSSPMKKDIATTSDEEEGVLKNCISVKKDRDDMLDSWRDLLEKPEEWWDYRENKQNGLVKPRHPDYKKKDGSVALWLDTAPNWVLSDLAGGKFDVPVSKPRQAKQHKDESWKDLVENPDKWWDNRGDKKNLKSPDFKHKETGVALWLSDSPTWVLPKLPSPKIKQAVTTGKNNSQPS